MGEQWNFVDLPTTDYGEDTGSGISKPSGTLCELRSYDIRTDSMGCKIVLRTGSRQALQYQDESDADKEAAMVLKRSFIANNLVCDTRLEIRSPHLKTAIRKVVKSYPDVNIGSRSHIVLLGPPRMLFHYRDELADYAKNNADPEVSNHVGLCLSHMVSSLTMDMQEYMFSTELSASDPLNPWFQWRFLWMLFRPGDLVYSRNEEIDSVSRLVSFNNGNLIVESMKCEGSRFGPVYYTLSIPSYESWTPIQDLPHFPLRYHRDQDRIRSKLINRGMRYKSLLGLHYRACRQACPQESNTGSDGMRRVQVQERIMIDYEPYSIGVKRGIDKILDHADGEDDLDEDEIGTVNATAGVSGQLTEEDFLICSPHIRGFSLSKKCWGDFSVDRIGDISFETEAFEHLVLPSAKKQLIHSLVDSQERQGSSFDDLVRGKGRGIIFLLHGPPGVGKTFTAESISEHTKRPLYTISCNDLGHVAVTAEIALYGALKRAERWNAIVLLDEADVFMAERTMEHLMRNELVAVLLRALDHFQGIMILTTNRVEAIDAAFKSRVHFSIAYPDLSPSSRATLWNTFITRACARDRADWLDQDFLEEVSRARMNGRQIRNAVRVAHALASKQNRELNKEDLRATLEALNMFEEESSAHLNKRSSKDIEEGGVAVSGKRARLDCTVE